MMENVQNKLVAVALLGAIVLTLATIALGWLIAN